MQHLAETFSTAGKGTRVTLSEALDEMTQYSKNGGKPTDKTYASIALTSEFIPSNSTRFPTSATISRDERVQPSLPVLPGGRFIDKIVKGDCDQPDKTAVAAIHKDKEDLDKIVKYIPNWVKFAVAIALGLGTMIGWKRIVVTVGEKIGKSHLTYAQGAVAELMAASTIGLADYLGLPVSTTHVLSSGIAGTMAANRSGLQKDTLIGILMAWVLTLPVCILLGATLFAAGLYMTFHVFGIP